MATVNPFEQRILQMDGREFQKLCDAYLYAIGYGKPNSFGSKAGSNQVRKRLPTLFLNALMGNWCLQNTQRNKNACLRN